MNIIVSLMAAGARKKFSKEEYRHIKKEADAPIIILDEATANVDPENEDKLISAFNALTEREEAACWKMRSA